MRLVRFKKEEIYQIMEIYSKKISIGEWKDYSMSFEKNIATFSIHRSFKVEPSYQIKKNFFKEKFYTLISHNNVIMSSNKLNKLINYLKKPNLKLVR